MNKFAFPRKLPALVHPDDALLVINEHGGMTLREYAAIKIAASMQSDSKFDNSTIEFVNKVAIFAADDLLKQLEETTT